MQQQTDSTLSLLRLLFVALLISLGLLYIVQWNISDSNKSSVEDFIIFYTAGTLAKTHGAEAVYNIEQQLETQRQILQTKIAPAEMLVYNHLPCLIPVFHLLASFNYTQAKLLWVAFLVALYFGATSYLVKAASNLTSPLATLVKATILLFYPIFVSLYHGQDTAFLFVGLTMWYIGLEKRQDGLSIAGMLLSTLRPHIAVGLIAAYSATHPKLLWKILAAGIAWVVLNISIVGLPGATRFIHILSLSATGASLRMSETAMLNLLGILYRLFAPASPSLLRFIGWVGYFMGIGLTILVWTKKDRPESWKISLAILIALFFAPHLHYHDLAVIMLPFLFVLSRNVSITSQYLATALPILFSFATLLTPTWYYYWPYLLYAILFVLLIQNDRTPAPNIISIN